MAQFATSSDLEARLGVTFDSAEASRANLLLTLASGLIQREARQRIELVTGDTLTIPATDEDRLRLPERPVASVASVTVNGVVLAATDWYLNHDEIIRTVPGAGWFYPIYQQWGQPSQTIQIVYTHGFEVIPDAIMAVCLEAATRVWVNPGNLMHEYLGLERTVYAMQQPPSGLLLTTDEIRVVHDVLRRPANSLALR